MVLSAALLCASALPIATTDAAPPAAPSCVEDVQTAFAIDTTGSGESHWSPNGRYVAYTAATITGLTDTNGAIADAVVRDRSNGSLEIVSVTSDEVQLSVASTALQVSDDGNRVLFASAGEFVTGETNGDPDVYLRDRALGTTVRVDLGPGGAELADGTTTAVMSADGAYVVFTTTESLDGADTGVIADVYRYDVVAQTVVLVSVNDDESEITDAAALLGVDSTGDRIYFSTGSGPATNHVRAITAGTTTLMPAETGFITRSGTSLVINTATSQVAADTDALVDAYLVTIAVTPVWTLISDPAFGLPTGIDIAANSVSTDLNFVNLTYDDGQPASVVVNRRGATLPLCGTVAAGVCRIVALKCLPTNSSTESACRRSIRSHPPRSLPAPVSLSP